MATPKLSLATPATIVLEALLAPIDGPNPSGKYLAYEPVYDAIREARRADDDTPQGEWERRSKVAEWDRVIDLATESLSTRSKDLQIAAWLTEALTKLHGFAGLRDGLRTLLGIQVQFWETYYPEIDDGDLDSRMGPFIFLNDPKLLPFAIRNVPFTRGMGDERYSFFKREESRATDNEAKKGDDRLKARIAEGKITVKQFDDEAATTPRPWYEQFYADLSQCEEAFLQFDQDTDLRFGKSAPSLINVGKAIQDCKKILEPLLEAKREQEPDPEPSNGPEIVDAEAQADADGTTSVNGFGSTTGGGDANYAIPKRTIGLGSEPEAPDYGRILIEFHDRAQQLAEVGNQLIENRRKYAELQAEMKTLDQEYDEISKMMARNKDYYQLLTRIVKLPGGSLG